MKSVQSVIHICTVVIENFIVVSQVVLKSESVENRFRHMPAST